LTLNKDKDNTIISGKLNYIYGIGNVYINYVFSIRNYYEHQNYDAKCIYLLFILIIYIYKILLYIFLLIKKY